MDKNRFFIAAAGAGKTTMIVREALLNQGGVLLVTFTEVNRDEIAKKVIEEKGYIPSNLTIMTWFSFLIQHGVKPYQGSYHPLFENAKFNGLILCKTGHEGKLKRVIQKQEVWSPMPEKENPLEHYSSKDGRLYSDRLPKLVVKIGETSKKRSYKRISALFPHIYIDEVQDLAGYDLAIVKALFATTSTITLVGDPRQYVFSTHREAKYKKYKNGNIREFLEKECTKGIGRCTIDDTTLNISHRNSHLICNFSSLIYKGEYATVQPCTCQECQDLRRDSEIRAITRIEAEELLRQNNKIVQLRHDKTTIPLSLGHKVLNMGVSKGLTFDTVIVYPTTDMKSWLKDSTAPLKQTTKAKLYIAITRARRNVYFVFDEEEVLPDLFQNGTSTS
ncbi:UvrD-helicase domain-containing protein [Bacteroides heparinolyticus]|uniref:UvrD-helicase domain-containing protein n=1 Tax=Prevotella heparinolytica TaxID=28113 RepID=UPI002A9D1AF6|nr:UvrD-helicase domain-containing protein [Porphyromonas sp.]